jgi:hypothetical protein
MAGLAQWPAVGGVKPQRIVEAGKWLDMVNVLRWRYPASRSTKTAKRLSR